MTVEVPILQISKFVENKLDRFARVLVFEADQAVKQNTPVDTGRLRASWMIGENDMSGIPASKETPSTSVMPPKGSNYKAGTEKVGNTYSIHNNLPYAEVICYTDHSKQVEVGWFELIGKNLQSRADELWTHISKDDF
jgi:hypothetical protein